MGGTSNVTVRRLARFWRKVKTYINNNAVSKIKEAFTTNVTVGAVSAGTPIAAGTDIVTIVKNMLVQLKRAVIASYPSVSLSNNGTVFGDYEVGTEIHLALGSSYTDGKFTSYTSPSATTTLNAGCVKGATTYYREMIALSGNTDTYILPQGTTTYRVEQEYGASTATAKNSDDSNAGLQIVAGVCNKGGNYNAYLRLFTGLFASVDIIPTTNLRSSLTMGALVKSAPSMSLAFSNRVVVIAVPASYTLISAIEPLTGEDERPYLAKNGEAVQIADINGDMHDYKLYAFAYDAVFGKSVNLVFN